MKQIVETTGEFQLYLPAPGFFAHAHRPSVVHIAAFFEQNAAAGRIKILGHVNDDATDEEFAAFLASAKGDVDLAVASFISSFPAEVTGKPPKQEPEPNPNRPLKPKPIKA